MTLEPDPGPHPGVENAHAATGHSIDWSPAWSKRPLPMVLRRIGGYLLGVGEVVGRGP